MCHGPVELEPEWYESRGGLGKLMSGMLVTGRFELILRQWMRYVSISRHFPTDDVSKTVASSHELNWGMVTQLGDGHAGFMPVYALLSTDGTVTFIEISKRPHELVEVLANIFNPTPIHIDPQL